MSSSPIGGSREFSPNPASFNLSAASAPAAPSHLMHRSQHLMSIQGYPEFMDALETAYTLSTIPSGQLKWVQPDGLKTVPNSELIRSFASTPQVITKIGEDAPMMAVKLTPRNGEVNVTGMDQYHAPQLVRDVNRWKFVKDASLGSYLVNGWSGVPESQEMFQQPRSLAEIIDQEGKNRFNVSDETPVVESLVLLPIAPNGEFTTEFTPQLRFASGDHDHYKVGVINGDKLSGYEQIKQDAPIADIKDIDEKQGMYNFRADFIPDLSDLEQAFLPKSAGHMIIIATPTEKPKPKPKIPDFNFDSYFNYGNSQTRGGSFSFGELTRGASIGSVNIGRGSQSGTGNIYQGDLRGTSKGKTTIYHLKFLGVRPEIIEQLKHGAKLSQLNPSIDAYPTNLN